MMDVAAIQAARPFVASRKPTTLVFGRLTRQQVSKSNDPIQPLRRLSDRPVSKYNSKRLIANCSLHRAERAYIVE
jgi:hypothetical protein